MFGSFFSDATSFTGESTGLDDKGVLGALTNTMTMGFMPLAGMLGRQQRKAKQQQESARDTARLESQRRQNETVKKEFDRRRGGSAYNTSNLSPGQAASSTQGTLLSEGNVAMGQQSILGGK